MGSAYAYRGFMLDTARHYMPVDLIKRVIGAAAACGMNRMHWHIVDDQGWRLEIRRYPRLTEVGSRRGPSFFGADNEEENNDGFYTQDEVRDVVAFAKARGVEIVPEIEIPGHASAMLAAYPEFACRREVTVPGGGTKIIDAPYRCQVGTIAGVFPELICAGREDSVQFLENILDEVCQLFPGPEVHIGGDEAIKLHWRRCPDCQARMKKMGLRDENELQRDLVLRMGDFLAKRGKKTIVWNESLEGGLLPDHFIVQHWLGNDRETAAFMAAGGKVIFSDVEYSYISRSYGDIDVYKIHQMPAVPEWAKEHPENLIGLECPMWGERVTNPERAEYMLFPRLAAMALRANRRGEAADWDEFLAEIRSLQAKWEEMGIHGAPERLWRVSPEDGEKERAHRERFRDDARMKRTWRICDGLLLQEKLEKLLNDIEMPRPLALAAMDWGLSDIPEYRSEGLELYDRGAKEMAEQLKTALMNREKGAWQGVDQKVWLDTMKCFTRFVREREASTGELCYDRGFWTVRQAEGRLFRLGELEYELKQDKDERVISIHIPSDAKLEAGPLNESVAAAKAFFAERFPEWADLPIMCHTWLLSPKLKELLPPSSRILLFQRAFDLSSINDGDMGAVRWVFNLTDEQAKNYDVKTLPEKTSLQRSMKALILSGGAPGSAKGFLARPFGA